MDDWTQVMFLLGGACTVGLLIALLIGYYFLKRVNGTMACPSGACFPEINAKSFRGFTLSQLSNTKPNLRRSDNKGRRAANDLTVTYRPGNDEDGKA
jgi:hypothetical protein